MEELGFMNWLASGGVQQWIEAFLVNNAKLIAGIVAIIKYFAVSTGEPDKNRILDLIKK